MKKQPLQIVLPSVIIAVSSLVLLGWSIGMDYVLNIIPGAPTMKFNTALLFICISFSIILLGKRNKLLKGIALGLAIFTFILSSLTLSQYLFSLNLGIDNLFLNDTLTAKNPGRMSRATAFCFMLLSAAKILRGIKPNRQVKIKDYLVTVVAIISLLVISTYLLMIITDSHVLVFNSMAIHTAIMFFLSSFAISLKHPDHSYVGFLTGRFVGSKQARSLLPFVVGLPIILSGGLLYSMNTGFLDSDYGIALYTISYAVLSLAYFSVIFTKLNNADEERSRLEEELKASNQELQQYKLALDESSIISITDLNGTITYVNDKFTEVSGFSKEEAVGKTHKIVNSDHHPDSFFNDLWKTIKNGSVWVGGIKNKTKSDSFYWAHVVIVPMRNISGETESFLTIEQDITQQTVLSNQYENLKLRNKEIEQFAYIASHDLQEPLKTLKSMTNILHKEYSDTLERDGEKIVGFISSAAMRMSALVKALLDYSIIGIHKELTKVDTSALVNSVKKDLFGLIETSNATIHYSDLPKIKAYPTELRLLFQNLISNAIKYKSPEKTPEIYISAFKDKQYYKFCVQDNGIGIAHDQLTNIFGLFKRLHKKRDYEGTGIGLAHCEKIIHLHGGSIWAESDLGKGSKFYFTIPIF
jgi:PAS domain S-box-containing protein